MNKRTFFSSIRNSRTKRIICAFLTINLIAEIVSPSVAMALTSGPTSPEFTSFEPVATTDMVNDFTGDFTYNIPVLNVPGPDGAGYSMSLAYHSGSSSEEEASWVGFGWTLNPGAINRNKVGYPDEFNGVSVKKYNKQKPNWTQTAKFDLNLEYTSTDKEGKEGDSGDDKAASKAGKKVFEGIGKGAGGGGNEGSEDPADISVSISHTVRYNNYSGFSIANGFGVGVKGMANLNMNRSGGQNTYGFSVNPIAIMNSKAAKKVKILTQIKKKYWGSKLEKGVNKINTLLKKAHIKNQIGNPSFFAIRVNNAPSLTYSVGKNSGASWNFSASVELNANIPVGIQVGIAGGMSIQAQEGEQDRNAYGYLYSGINNTGTEANVWHDYQIEKETTFDKHDKNLGIPYNNADVFTATGNNVTGGFKLYHDNIGSFYPDRNDNVCKIRQLGVELGIGATIQIGFDIGIGKQKTEIKGQWPKMPSLSSRSFPQNPYGAPPKMRFTGDLGGEIKYGDYASIENATVGSNHVLDLDDIFVGLHQELVGNSSSIKYTQEGIDPATTTAATAPTNPSINKIEITNKDGGKSIYGIPVYTKNETELSIGLDANQDGQFIVANTPHGLNVDNPMENKTAVGQKTLEKYATAYLLTENKTFNYVDADGDGKASNDDFGGWTKFAYRQVYGSNPSDPNDVADWYRYRSPYAGLNYNRGRMLENDDQTGSMSAGYKQVHYLKSIETKSHIAFFVTNKTALNVAGFISTFPVSDFPFLYDNTGTTPLPSVMDIIKGSGIERYDGVDAAAVDASTGMDPAAYNLSVKGIHKLEKLERIVLFAKSDLSKPLTTTFFEYDNSLCQGIPNSITPVGATAKDKGKLTLKRVWTESGGVNISKISPYQFDYEYFHQYPSSIVNAKEYVGGPAKYPWAATFNSAYSTNDPKQNPYYKPEHLDIWGNYQLDGASRFAKEQHWLSQKPPAVANSFDPAAWQLKRIKLPSGGEIHVQYEQKDYTSVQDENPMAMVSLVSGPVNSNNIGYKSDENSFYINTSDLNISSSEIPDYTSKLKEYFIENKHKLYFKALYTFTGDDSPAMNTGSPRYEYVTGYVSVNSIVHNTSSGLIVFQLGDTREKNGDGKKDKTLPRYVCYQEALTNGGVNLGLNSRAYVSDDYTDVAYSDNPISDQDFLDASRQHVLSNTIEMFQDWIGGHVKNVKKNDACKEMNFSLSYFKLPTYHAKKGGGIRVKRLLTYDAGISGEAGSADATIYGTEYVYENEDGTSSGVATNEPEQGREENALVGYLERKRQMWIDKIMNGRDTKQFEGPLGENALPSATVVHKRVVIKNIHNGKTTTGYVVNNYHTVKDFPFEADCSSISKKDGTYKKLNLSLPLGLFNLDIHRAWVTQGYIFKDNDMNGKLASKATYAGNYNRDNFKESGFTSKTTYNYSEPGKSIPSIVYSGGKFTSQMLNPGTEEDLTMFMSNVHEKSNNFSVEIDLNLSFYPLTCGVGIGLSYSFSDQLLCQHVTSKVIHEKSYLLSTTNVTDGVTQTTENLAFDKNTGDPVLTRTFDGYMAPNETIYTDNSSTDKHKGYYYSFNVPASWMYPTMGPITDLMPDNTNQLSAVAGNVVTYGVNQIYEDLATPSAFSTTTTATWKPTVSLPLTNVVSASATTYTNNWFNGVNLNNEYPLPIGVTYTANAISQLNKFFYPRKTYAYKANVSDANNPANKIYKGGLVEANFKFFDWTLATSVPGEWYSDGTITKYSPYGYPVEEQDVLGIKSSAKFGYNNTLPVSVVQNAGYDETKFIDFEYGFVSSPTGIVTTQFAHTGRASYDLSLDPNHNFVTNYPISNAMISGKGLGIKLWLRNSLSEVVTSPNYRLKNPNLQLKAIIGTQPFDMKLIAQTGEWSLYSVDIKNFVTIPLSPSGSANYNIKLSYNHSTVGSEKVLIDDFRVQPLDASMNCSVYMADNKVAAQFDDQHFGVFYEYNNKGQLVRKSIETINCPS